MLYNLESTRPSIWAILILCGICILAVDYSLKMDFLPYQIFLGTGAFFACLGALYQIYLFVSGKTLASVETLENSLSLTYHNGKKEVVPYKDIGTVMVIPSPGYMIPRKYWLLNFFHGRGKHKSLKFWDEKAVRDIAKDMQDLGGRRKMDMAL